MVPLAGAGDHHAHPTSSSSVPQVPPGRQTAPCFCHLYLSVLPKLQAGYYAHAHQLLEQQLACVWHEHLHDTAVRLVDLAVEVLLLEVGQPQSGHCARRRGPCRRHSGQTGAPSGRPHCTAPAASQARCNTQATAQQSGCQSSQQLSKQQQYIGRRTAAAVSQEFCSSSSSSSSGSSHLSLVSQQTLQKEAVCSAHHPPSATAQQQQLPTQVLPLSPYLP